MQRHWRETVLKDWTDYNGHLNEAYYLLIFSHATDVFMKEIGVDPALPERRTVNSLYTLESHLRYLLECGAGDVVEVRTRLLDFDTKRYHCLHEMFPAASDKLLATAEMVMLHVDMTGPRAAAFPDATAALLRDRLERDRALEPSPYLNGAMGLVKKR